MTATAFRILDARHDSKCYRVLLPFPPSVNGLFRDGSRGSGKRPRTKKYLAWIAEADALTLASGPLPQITGKVHLTICLGAPDKRRRDCTNYVKAIEDWLVSRKIIEGDDSRFVRRVCVGWADMNPGALVEVWQI